MGQVHSYLALRFWAPAEPPWSWNNKPFLFPFPVTLYPPLPSRPTAPLGQDLFPLGTLSKPSPSGRGHHVGLQGTPCRAAGTGTPLLSILGATNVFWLR